MSGKRDLRTLLWTLFIFKRESRSGVWSHGLLSDHYGQRSVYYLDHIGPPIEQSYWLNQISWLIRKVASRQLTDIREAPKEITRELCVSYPSKYQIYILYFTVKTVQFGLKNNVFIQLYKYDLLLQVKFPYYLNLGCAYFEKFVPLNHFNFAFSSNT